MKRRTFLTTASTVGIVGAVSATTLVSSAYTSISTSILLEEFDSTTRSALDNFLANVKQNTEALGLDEKHATQVAMPAQIISKKSTLGNKSIVYKNKCGDYVSLSVKKGVERVQVRKTL